MTLDYVIEFIIIALAVYRLSVMIASEHGPFDVIDWTKDRFKQGSMMRKLLNCPFCLSVWFGVLGACFLPFYGFGWYGVTVFSLSGVTTLLLRKYG